MRSCLVQTGEVSAVIRSLEHPATGDGKSGDRLKFCRRALFSQFPAYGVAEFRRCGNKQRAVIKLNYVES